MFTLTTRFLLILFFVCLLPTKEEEICDLKKIECFPIHNNTFTAILSQFSDEEIVKRVNEYSKSRNFFRKKMEFRKTPDRGMALFALEYIPNGFEFHSVPFDELIGKNDFYSVLDLYGIDRFEFDMEGEDVLNLERLRLCFLMHHHLSNLWSSKFFGDIIGLPKYATSPTLTIPYEAVKHMNYKERNEVLQLRKKVKERYEFYVKTIKKHIPDHILTKMLNGTSLNFANFAYCLSIFESRSATLDHSTNDPEKRDSALVPGFHYVNTMDELRLSDKKIGGFSTKNKIVSIKAPGNIQPGEEAYNLYGLFPNWRFLINFGYLPRINEIECLDIDNITFLQSLRTIPRTFGNANLNLNCLQSHVIDIIYANINMMNLDKGEVNRCLGLVKGIPLYIAGKTILRSCLHSTISKGKNVWLELKNVLLHNNMTFTQIINKLEGSRVKSIEKLSPEETYSYDLIINYYKEKVKLINGMIGAIDEIEDLNPSLKPENNNVFSSRATSKGETCEFESRDCFPIEGNDFTAILSGFTKVEMLSGINNHSQTKGFFKHKMEFRKTKEKGVGLFSLEDIPKGSKVLDIDYTDVLGKEEFYRILEKHGIAKFEFLMNNEGIMNTERLRLVFAIHYNLANLWESKFFMDLIGLPKYAESPSLTIPYEAIMLMAPDERDEILKLRDQTKARYKFYLNTIKQKIPEPVLSKMLNGTKLSFANFAYCLSIFKSRSATIGDLKSLNIYERDTVLAPGFHYINSLNELYEAGKGTDVFVLDYEKLSIFAYDFILMDSEVYTIYGHFNNWRYLRDFGFFPKVNEFECVTIDNSTFLSKLGRIPFHTSIPGLKCLRKSTIKSLYANILIMNMNQNEASECKANFEDSPNHMKNEIIMSDCTQVEIKKGTIVWGELSDELRKVLEKFAEIVKNLEALKEITKAKFSPESESSFNLLLSYYSHKVKLIKSMLLEMRTIELSNQSIKKRKGSPEGIPNPNVDSNPNKKTDEQESDPLLCNINQVECFPVSDNDFAESLSSFSKTDVLRSLNTYSRRFLKRKSEFRLNSDQRIGLFALESIENDKTVLSFSKEEILGEQEFYKILSDFGIKKFDFVKSPKENIEFAEQLRLAFVIHFHLANLWGSKFFGDLAGLPKDAINPLLLLSFEEVNSLPKKEREDLLQLRQRMKDKFMTFNRVITENIPEEKIKTMFNEVKFKFSNFVFCISIIEGRASLINEELYKDTVLIPGLHYINTAQASDNDRGLKIIDDNSRISVLTQGEIKAGMEILSNNGNPKISNWRLLINSGSLPKFNEYECLYIENPTLVSRMRKVPHILSSERKEKSVF